MSAKDDFFACAGELREETHTLPNNTTILIGEMGGDEWLEVENEAASYRRLHGVSHDPFLEARCIVRSCTSDGKTPIFKRPIYGDDPKENEEIKKAYEADLQKIMKMPRRVFIPLRDIVDRVNFADDASFAALKKKSEKAASNGSTNSAPEAVSGTSER